MSSGLAPLILGTLIAAVLQTPASACEPRNPRVYFPSGSHDPDPASADLFESELQAAATLARSPEVRRVVVSGFADAAGSTAFNLRLSEVRARVLAERLVRLGVPPSKIQVEYFGEGRPSVPTGEGMPEPLNRYAEISGDWPVDPNCGMSRKGEGS